jgi:hypothetical protein
MITSVEKVLADDGVTLEGYIVVADEVTKSVPIEPKNPDYQAVLQWEVAGGVIE